MSEIEDLSVTDASNTTRFGENQTMSSLNDGARALEGMLARWYADTNGSIISAGTDTITLAAARTISAYAQGQVFIFEAGGTNTGAVTLNVDSVGAKAIVKNYNVALAANDIKAGQIVAVAYEATADNFQMLSPLGNTAGAGDLLAANNLSDVADAATSLSNIGGIGAATSDTLTNKTFDANGTGNNLSNVDVADLANGTDGELITWDAAGAPATVAVGTATHVLTSNGAGTAPTFQAAGGGGFTLGTEQSTGSGSSVTFGSIPAGTTMIVIMFEDVSYTGAVDVDVTIGDAGGLETSGYVSTSHEISNTSPTHAASTAEFIMHNSNPSWILSGHMTLTLKDAANFTWVESHTIKSTTNVDTYGGGHKSLSAELTQVSIGGGTFDGGSINIMYI